MFENESYLPKSREYFWKYLNEKKDELYIAMLEYKVGPGSGYGTFYRGHEITQCMRDIYHNINETFNLLRIPEDFSSPKALVNMWYGFNQFLKKKDELFDDVTTRLIKKIKKQDYFQEGDNPYEYLPEPLKAINHIRMELIDVLDHIMKMDELKSYLEESNSDKKVSSSLAVPTMPDIAEIPTTTNSIPTNPKIRLEIIAAILTIIASVFGIYSYFGNSKISVTPQTAINATATTNSNNNVTTDSKLTINAPAQNINVTYGNSGNTHVTEKASTIVTENKGKAETTSKYSHVKSSQETLTALKAEYRNQYSDIDLCDAEDRQKNIAKYRQAYAQIQEIKVIASKIKDVPSLNWVNGITCNGTQKTGGIQIIKNTDGIKMGKANNTERAIEQNTDGNQSPAIISGRDVIINYGNK